MSNILSTKLTRLLSEIILGQLDNLQNPPYVSDNIKLKKGEQLYISTLLKRVLIISEYI